MRGVSMKHAQRIESLAPRRRDRPPEQPKLAARRLPCGLAGI